jgi:hypothetical protein
MEEEDKILDEIDKANASSDLVDAFKEPFESDNLSKSMFEALPGVFDDPTFGDFNRTVVGGAVDALDLGLRTIESGVKGGATAINEAKNYITGQDDDRLKRDLINFFVTAGVGGATSGSMRMQKGISEFAKQGKKEDVAKVILAESDAFKNDNLKPVMAMTSKREPSPVRQMTESDQTLSVFPKPERMFPKGEAPKGGDYINPKTGDILTDRNVSSANIKINPDGKPSFNVSNDNVDNIGTLGKGNSQIKTNLFKKKAGWKWIDAPSGMDNIETLVSVTHKGKHFYTIETDFTKGVNLKKYPNQKDEPKLRPTVVGQIELGQPIGEISVRGNPHKVYNKIKTFNRGGLMARN